MPDLRDGESAEVQGSARTPYILKNVGGLYSCSCPAWRNQSLPIERRTCKHLRAYRGDQVERERLGPLPAAAANRTASLWPRTDGRTGRHQRVMPFVRIRGSGSPTSSPERVAREALPKPSRAAGRAAWVISCQKAWRLTPLVAGLGGAISDKTTCVRRAIVSETREA